MCSLGSIPSCPVEDIFLCRLLQKDSIEANGSANIIKYVEEALFLRHASTRVLLTLIEDSVNSQRVKTESVARALNGNISLEGQKNPDVRFNCKSTYSYYVLVLGLSFSLIM